MLRFNKILIANRGEIACRIIRTAKDLGISTVAVYSSIDKDSLFVSQADEAFWIGDSPAIDSYLNFHAIIRVAKETGAQAIHPGYGFLSENPRFALACAEAEIVFIGPSINALEAMASKQFAKQLLEKTKVPLTPGYHGENQTEAHLFAEAVRIGFPILLKAAAGGGGKGMRSVKDPSQFMQALAAAKREAKSSFDDDTMIIEKLIANPRHIEVQIMADNYGNVVHLFERDCSIQRRHQKIIEEAPAYELNKKLRQDLTQAACEVAKSINYRGAGTVEFLVDEADHFYFMEMNTRLQVEHPVTEMITGLDLVAWQIAIAEEKPLPCLQKEIEAHGHAIECRIYAEDPEQDFLPSIGTINFLKAPQGHHIRIDSGVNTGSLISQYYDPMIAKLIAFGESREEAVQRMQQALNHYLIGGVKTNIGFLQGILKHPRFIKGDINTNFLNEETLEMPLPDQELAILMAASHQYLALSQEISDPLLYQSFGWQMHLRGAWSWSYIIQEQRFTCLIRPINQQQFELTYSLSMSRGPNSEIAPSKHSLKTYYQNGYLIIDTGLQQKKAWVEQNAEQIQVYLSEGLVLVKLFSWQNLNIETKENTNHLIAPMPATIVAILKNTGDIVKKGEPLLILEAMKMEHVIHSPKNGKISDLLYTIGSQVHEGAELVILE
jgi:3-methylcrotonyl-CoA carboxylase alpha subunit